MSLYNNVHGTQITAPIVLSPLGLTVEDIPRFRDAFFVKRKGVFYHAIRTRTGAGGYDESSLLNHARFVGREIDTFDSTFALFLFTIQPGSESVVDYDAVMELQNPLVEDLRALTDEGIEKVMADMRAGRKTALTATLEQIAAKMAGE